MATKDFRASQIETSKIIGTGSISGTTAGIAIYSGSIASNREGGVVSPHNTKMFENVGTDVFLFVSGTRSNDNFTRTDATLFGGDVVISGTLYAERQVIEVDSVADGDFFVTGSMFVEPDNNSTKSVAFRNAAGSDIFIVDSTNKRIGVNVSDPDAQVEIFGTSTPHLKLSNNAADFATFAVGTHGDLTITTVDANAGAANFVIDADGAVDIDADAGALSLDGSTGINIGTEADVAIDIDASTLDIDASGALTIDSATSIAIGVTADKPVTIESTTLDVNSSGAITIDSTSTFSVDAVGTSNITTNGALTLSGSTGLNIAADSGEIDITATKGNVDINAIAGTIDIDSAGALTIDSATSISIGTTADKPVSIDSTSFALDASTTVAIDGTGISIDGVDDSNITVTASAKDLDIAVAGGGTQELRLTSAGTGTSALHLNASAGNVNIDAVGPITIDGDRLLISNPATPGADTLFSVSGSIGSRGTSTKGTSLFGGDLVVSGNTKFHDDIIVEFDKKIFFDGAGPSSGNGPFIFGNTVALSLDGDNRLLFYYDTDAVFSDGNNETPLVMNNGQVLILSGGPATSVNETDYNDLAFFVSGSIGSRGTSTKGTAVFGGDLVVSGNTRLHGNVIVGGAGDGTDSIFFDGGGGNSGPWIRGNAIAMTIDGDRTIDFRFSQQARFTADSGTKEVVQIFEPSATAAIEPQQDALQIFSGTMGSKGTTTRGVAVFTGDVVISGTLHGGSPLKLGADIGLNFDGSKFAFGVNNEITLTHVHDVGLTVTNTIADADNKPVVFQLKSEEDVIVADDVIASIEFAAGDAGGTDAADVAAGIHAIAEGTFGEDANATKLVFTTGVQESANSGATAKMTLDSAGNLKLAGELQAANIGYTDGDNAIVIANGGGITAAAGITSTAAANLLGATSFNDANITNVGDLDLDSLSVDDAAVGLDIQFGGNTELNLISLTDNLADALNITQAANSYIKFVTTNTSEKIVVAKKLEISSGIIDVTNATENSLLIPDNKGDALVIKEDSNLYAKFATTNTSELITLFKPVEITNGAAGGATALIIDNDDVDQKALLIEAANTTAHVVDIIANTLTTNQALKIEANALTTGGGFIVESSSTQTDAGNLVKIKQSGTRGSNSNNHNGLFIDYDVTSGTAARALKIDSQQTTGKVFELDADAITTGTGMAIHADALTTGAAFEVTSNSSTTNSPTEVVRIFQEHASASGRVPLNVKNIATNTGANGSPIIKMGQSNGDIVEMRSKSVVINSNNSGTVQDVNDFIPAGAFVVGGVAKLTVAQSSNAFVTKIGIRLGAGSASGTTHDDFFGTYVDGNLEQEGDFQRFAPNQGMSGDDPQVAFSTAAQLKVTYNAQAGDTNGRLRITIFYFLCDG